MSKRRTGYVALIGRTNAGKSTFLNYILESKVAIVSNKPQTTRRRILGIKTTGRGQIIFFDSPGVHRPFSKLNERMMKDVHHSMFDADLILYFVEIGDRRDDTFIHSLVEKLEKPAFLIINKIDTRKKSKILERIDHFRKDGRWDEIVPISALRGDNVDHLEDTIYQYLPAGDNIFPAEETTQQSESFYIAELIREKLLTLTRDELPFTTSVKVQEISPREKITYIRAEIYVETNSQKKIIIGRGGSLIKQVGQLARKEVEEYLQKKVFLDLFVKIVPNWRNSQHVLQDVME